MKSDDLFSYIVDKDKCAPCKKKNNGFNSCYSKESLIKIATEWNKKNKNKEQIIFLKFGYQNHFFDI